MRNGLLGEVKGSVSGEEFHEVVDDRVPVVVPSFQTRPTVRLDMRNLKPTWPVVIATLQQLSDWGAFAMRLGTLALIQTSVHELTRTNAKADLVVHLRALTDALAHMPLAR